MTIPNSISSATLARYFGDTAAPEEQALVEGWIGDDPARQAAVAAWRAAWRADAEHLGAAYDADAAWARLSARVGLPMLVRDERPTREIRLTPLVRPVSPRLRAVRWAAAAVVVLAAGVGVWRTVGHREIARAATMPATREYVTPRGQRSVVRLPDGSEVLLNVASRLIVPATFGAAGHPRALQLEGQAYFTVVHDDTRPFTVRTAHGITRDIGTRFDIRAYPGDREDRVAVTEGEVAVRSDSAMVEMSLRAGQAAKIAASGRVMIAPNIDVDQVLAWTQGRLELDDVTLAEAARRLSRWYDLDVHVADAELAQRRVVGSYRDEPLAQVLTIVAAAVGAGFEWHGQSVTFVLRNGR